jgi:hypothetical protein
MENQRTIENVIDDDFNFQELDTNWIHDFEKEDVLYKDFYLEELYFVNIYFVYLNDSNKIEKVKKDKFFFNEKHSNTLPKEELFKIIVKNKNINNENYKLNFLFKYNFTVDSHNLINLLQNNIPIISETEQNNSYLSTITSIENVQFQKTITMFQDLNSITIIYKKSQCASNMNNEKNNNDKNKTKCLRIKKNVKRTTRLYV